MMADIKSHDPPYWDNLQWLPGKQPITSDVCKELVRYMENTEEKAQRRSRLNYKQQCELHELKLKLRKTLSVSHRLLPLDRTESFKIHEHHFYSRDVQGAWATNMWEQPPAGTLCVRSDFGENRTVPLGPEDSQDWWFATSRPIITNQHFCCWMRGADGEVKQSFFYLLHSSS